MSYSPTSRFALLAALGVVGCVADVQQPSTTSRPAIIAPAFEPGIQATAWTAKTDVPFPRANSIAVTARQGGDARVYLFGGYVQTNEFELEGIRRFDVYDPRRDKWVRKGHMPFGVYAPNGAEVLEGKIYIPGGFRSTFAALSTMFEYTIRTNSWRTLPGPRPGGYGASGVIGGQLYVFTGEGPTKGIGYLDRFDPATETWTSLPDAPHAHLAGGAAVIGGKLYVVGGISDCCSAVTGELDVYDPATNSWSTLATMPNPRLLMAVAALHGKLYVFGGRANDVPVADVDIYDPVTNTWTPGVPMPLVRESPAVALVKPVTGSTFAYLMGGADPALIPNVTSNQVFDPNGN
jgi:N-acetylneuraminic acid mutarotase